jgi:hypothetical protein
MVAQNGLNVQIPSYDISDLMDPRFRLPIQKEPSTKDMILESERGPVQQTDIHGKREMDFVQDLPGQGIFAGIQRNADILFPHKHRKIEIPEGSILKKGPMSIGKEYLAMSLQQALQHQEHLFLLGR